jgi:hypothetical protein
MRSVRRVQDGRSKIRRRIGQNPLDRKIKSVWNQRAVTERDCLTKLIQTIIDQPYHRLQIGDFRRTRPVRLPG